MTNTDNVILRIIAVYWKSVWSIHLKFSVINIHWACWMTTTMAATTSTEMLTAVMLLAQTHFAYKMHIENGIFRRCFHCWWWKKNRSECRWSVMTLNVQQLLRCIFGICIFSDQHSIRFVHVLMKSNKNERKYSTCIRLASNNKWFESFNSIEWKTRTEVMIFFFRFFLFFSPISSHREKRKLIEHHVQFCYRYSCRYC